MATDTGKNIAEMFSTLPESIKEWLASEELVFIITDIETKLGLSDEKILVIPNLILRLTVQDIEPQEFISELSRGLGVDFPVAKTIAEDIERKALRPIEAELRNKTGLEVKLIFYGKTEGEKIKTQAIPAIGKIQPAPSSLPKMTIPSASSVAGQTGQAPSATATAAQSMPSQAISTKPMSPLTFTPSAAPLPSEKKVMPAPTPQPIRKEELPYESATPFILHQEGSPTAAPTLNPNNSMAAPQGAQTSSLPKTSLTMKVQNYFQSAGIPERPISKPISIKVEAPAAQQAIAQTEQKIPVMKQPALPVAPAYAPIMPKAQPSPVTIPTMPAPAVNSPAGQAPSASSGQARVVNYSNLRTPVNNLGLPKKEVDRDNVVDLRKFS